MEGLAKNAATLFVGLFLIGFIIFVRARWKGKISGEKKGSGEAFGMVDSPQVHRMMMILAMLFALALLGFAVTGVIKDFMHR